MSVNLENSSVTTGLEKVSFHSNSKKGNAQKRSNYHTVVFISQASMVLLKNFHDSHQQYMNWEIPDGSQRGRGTRDQIASTHWIMEKAREFLQNIYFIEYAKALDFVDHKKLWKILKELGILERLTCLLRNLYVSQKAIFRSVHATTDWLKIEKGEWESYTFSPCLYSLYLEYIMWNA